MQTVETLLNGSLLPKNIWQHQNHVIYRQKVSVMLKCPLLCVMNMEMLV